MHLLNMSMMHAALVDSFGVPPRYGEIAQPEPAEDDVLIRVKAAALTNLVRGQASGTHYSSEPVFPAVPGNDGVGLMPDGTRVYFVGPETGSMAEWTVVDRRRTIPLPDSLDDVTAAALGNPGLATWGSLLGRAKFQAGEAVLINGATGTAGRQAIQVAKYLGASRIVATGRDEAALEGLRDLGATETISLNGTDEELSSRFAPVVQGGGIQVVLDYLWGPSALAILTACGGHGSLRGEPRIRFVQIGAISGRTLPLPADILRSSGVEILGSGLGSLSAAAILESLRTMYQAAATTRFVIDTEAVPLSEVTAAWTSDTGNRRLVFIP
ncbi:Zn-dependent oxidoreductase, NADPH:quinone reductase [Terriglobus roseus DSM 18391]|uniref:Zn-dependent oxidoreductase, NADPH:quinone reductase n=2 Tax=Terriglobus roseus TaxID=392734 RepID=I3ZJZ3_TERRK|nr:Zn-dependent oxidoreductase, NADPH:quinone reductase [Terriglobus roseus DSM 18391]